jgi:hypothetical protein
VFESLCVFSFSFFGRVRGGGNFCVIAKVVMIHRKI